MESAVLVHENNMKIAVLVYSTSPYTRDVNWKHIRRSEDVLDASWMSYVRSVIFNVKFHNVSKRRNNVVKMTISKNDKKKIFQIEYTEFKVLTTIP